MAPISSAQTVTEVLPKDPFTAREEMLREMAEGGINGGPSPFDARQNLLHGMMLEGKTPEEIMTMAGFPGALGTFGGESPDATGTSVARPGQRTNATLPDPPGQLPSLSEALTAVGTMALNVAKGGVNLGANMSGGGVLPLSILPTTTTQEEADAINAGKAIPVVQGPEDVAHTKEFIAFATSMAVGGVGTKLIRAMNTNPVVRGGAIGAALDALPQTAKNMILRDMPAGATFGALLESENTMTSIATNAALFSGLGYVGAMLRPLAPGAGKIPMTAGVEGAWQRLSSAGAARLKELRGRGPIETSPHFVRWQKLLKAKASRGQLGDTEFKAGRKTATEVLDPALEDALIAGWARSEAAAVVRADLALQARDFGRGAREAAKDAPLFVDEFAGEVVADLNPIWRALGSQSRWADKVGGVVGDLMNRVVVNAIDRVHLQTRMMADWAAIKRQAQKELYQGIPRSERAAARSQLRESLDSVFRPDQLPPGLPENVKNAFQSLRVYTEQSRTMLSALRIIDPVKWGIDGYFPHVFVGDWALQNAKTGGNIKFVQWSEAKKAVADIHAERAAQGKPPIKIRMEPRFNRSSMSRDLAVLGVNGQAMDDLVEAMRNGLRLEADDVVALIEGAEMPFRPAGKKYLGHMEPRAKNMPGFLEDPFQAMDIYNVGMARKVAFHDFRQKADMMMAQARIEGMGPTADAAMEGYMNRVMGVPGAAERSIGNAMSKVVEGMSPETWKPFLERNFTPRRVSGMVATAMYLSKLGWSAPAVVAQLSQTVINTATLLGYRPVARAMKELATRDPAKQKWIRGLLAEMEPELMAPLGVDVLTPILKDVPWWWPTYAFNKGDTWNRAIAGFASYLDDAAKGIKGPQAMANARKIIRETNFEYSIADAPAFTAGPLGQLLFQFKKFTVKELEFLWAGATKGTAKQRTAFLTRFAANATAVGGIGVVMDLPPFALVDMAIGKLTGKELGERIRAEAPEKLGRLGTFAAHGLPGLMIGADISQTVSVGIPAEAKGLLGPLPTDMLAIAQMSMPEPVRRLILGKNGSLSPTERDMVVRQWLPVMARRMWDATKIAEDGVVRNTGKTKLFTAENRWKEIARTATGFQSINKVLERDAFRIQTRRIKSHNDQERVVTDRVARAWLVGNQAEARRILRQSVADKLVISDQQIKAAIQKLNMDRFTSEALGGPAELRQEFIREAPPGTTFNP